MQPHSDSIATLVRFDAQSLLPVIMDFVEDQLSVADLFTVTQNEVDIMRTPDGELFDKSIIER